MQNFEALLSGGDLRSVGRSRLAIPKIKDQHDFDALFTFLFHPKRLVVMRAADAVEKITIDHPDFLQTHKKEILQLLASAQHKELKWHLAILAPRVRLNKNEFETVWAILMNWAEKGGDSKLVRVAAVQGLYEMTKQNRDFLPAFTEMTEEIEKENIASVNARIRNIRKEIVLLKYRF